MCGERHSIVTGENGHIYGFGDNSAGQIDDTSTRGEFIISKPKIIKQIHKFKNSAFRVHSGKNLSAITVDYSQTIDSRKIYAWGGKTIVDTISS